jgi:mannose-1-phosphate guanylyltransferase
MRAAAEACCPEDLELHFSHEPELLGTGGGIRRVASFLRDSDPCLVVAGDMLLDADLAGFARRHRERGDAATLLLRSDPRSAAFGAVGIDAEGSVRRIGREFDLGGSAQLGLFVGVRAFAPRCFDALPEREDAFEDLRDWLAPALRAGARDIRGELSDAEALGWEPVGTPAEYLRANLDFDPRFDRWDVRHRRAAARIEDGVVIGRNASVPEGVRLENVVIWEGERVPPGTQAAHGVFAGGRFVEVAAPPGGRA